MTDVNDENDEAAVLLRLIGADPAANDEVLALVPGTRSASVLTAAALLSRDPDMLARAAQLALAPRERQLVALADAHLHGQADLFDGLVRDHLSEHPDHLLAAWIASRPL
ncbi:MAG: hypothetical protein L0H79_06310 [Intrasporangium sp.]|uniref:hypothetical protein n=1 Tax=Intrasporangium sp. TaxID=1925024 RepID=UPI002647153F|nr:hypothetical protein [Intrasporangium sp.]MDN5795350.1 hypothetical protein [Intrasporangium sp.]